MIRITSPHFCAGADMVDGFEGLNVSIVLRPAPIIKYMAGWTIEEVEQYCERKGWKLERL